MPTQFSGTAPSPFIGRFGYPFINIGFFSTDQIEENAFYLDSPDTWGKNSYSIEKVVDFRQKLINSMQKSYIQKSSKTLDIVKEIGLSSTPVDLEVKLKKEPYKKFHTSIQFTAHGPRALLKSVSLSSNPKIHTKIDKVASDHELKANCAIDYLQKNNFNENTISKLLSIGEIGIKRKLVPSRWSITATDDMLSKNLLRNINDYNELDYSFYYSSYIGNHYLFLFFPDNFSYELFECSTRNYPTCSTDYEGYYGRKTYARYCTGGYYTVRLAIAEHLKKSKRKGSCLVLRFVTPEYHTPLGVWVTRESARKALKTKPIFFSSTELLLTFVKQFVIDKFGLNINSWFSKSKILNNIKFQKKLAQYGL